MHESKPPIAKPKRKHWIRWVAWAVVGIGAAGFVVTEFVLGPDATTSAPPGLSSGAPLPSSPAAPLAGEPLPDLNGTWRTPDGGTYHVAQSGHQVTVSFSSEGTAIGKGQGRFDGGTLRLTMWGMINGIPVASVDCTLQGSAGNTHFAGPCQGPTGEFVARIFR